MSVVGCFPAREGSVCSLLSAELPFSLVKLEAVLSTT
jgi:hypothetical protein